MLSRFTRPVVNFLKDESGPTAVEYAVMLALNIVVCVTASDPLGTNANNTFTYVGAKVGSTGTWASDPRNRLVTNPNCQYPRTRRGNHAQVQPGSGQLPEGREWPDGGRIRRHAGPDHRGVHHGH